MDIIVTDREGGQHRLDWDPTETLMETLRDNGLPVLASCGGQCSCATCHVHLDPEGFALVGPGVGEEEELLAETDAYRPDASRLSCQIRHELDLAGLRVTLAPEE